MSSDTAKRLGMRRAGDTFMAKVEQLVLVTDLEDPSGLFDERALTPVDMLLADDIDEIGQRSPIDVKDFGAPGSPVLKIAAGRNRYKAIIEVNRRRAERGEEPLEVWVKLVPKTVSADDIMLSENHRVKSPPLRDARIMKRYLARHGDTKETRERFCRRAGVSRATVGRWLDILDAHPDVIAAIERKDITENEAIRIVKAFAYDDQPMGLPKAEAHQADPETAPDAAPKGDKHEKERKPREKSRVRPAAQVKRLDDEVKKAVEDAGEDKPESMVVACALLAWIHGDDAALDGDDMADVKRLALRTGWKVKA